MVFRTKTAKRTMEIYSYIQQREYLQPFILAKISIALAIKNKYKFDGCLSDTAGLDLNRQTITGEYDLLFKKLIEMNEGHRISEEEYFSLAKCGHTYQYTKDELEEIIRRTNLKFVWKHNKLQAAKGILRGKNWSLSNQVS